MYAARSDRYATLLAGDAKNTCSLYISDKNFPAQPSVECIRSNHQTKQKRGVCCVRTTYAPDFGRGMVVEAAGPSRALARPLPRPRAPQQPSSLLRPLRHRPPGDGGATFDSSMRPTFSHQMACLVGETRCVKSSQPMR